MADDGNTDVYVVGADGLGQQRLTRHPGVDGNPAWSPDGRKIAFTRRARECCLEETYIYVMNADGSRQQRLALGHVHFSVAWSPDGQKMLFERPNPRHPAVGLNPKDFAEDLHVMNADGSGQRNLTRRPVRDYAPVWSPDGRQIAWNRGRQIWLMNPDGSGQRSLTPAAGGRSGGPDWSPDGRKIAFGGRAPTSPPDGGIFVSNADGSERRRFTQRGWSPAWSPDGRKIAFLTKRDRYSELYTMNADGSGQRNLTRSAGTDLRFAWSPDGKMIAFDRHLATGEELYVMTADGSGKRRLMRSDGWSGWGVPVPWWAWSPTPKRQ
jgi:Tol biopolymer transport system component